MEEKTGTLRRLAAVKTEPIRRPDRMQAVKQQDRQRSMAVYGGHSHLKGNCVMVLQDIGPRRLDGGPATEVQLLWSPASKEAKKAGEAASGMNGKTYGGA